MSISCEVIRDLLPLYHDGICSEETIKIVEEHLNNCEECRKYLEEIDEDLFKDSQEEVKVKNLKGLKHKFLKKKVIVSIISIVITLAISLGVWSCVFYIETPIKYEEGLVDVNLAYDDVLDIFLNKDDYYCSYQYERTFDIDGKNENVLYIYYTDTIWTKYLSPKNGAPYQTSINNNVIVDYENGEDEELINKGISKIYYLPLKMDTEAFLMSDEEFNDLAKDAVLLWEK